MVNGIINVYKEKGYTSFDVVAKMRGIFHQKKIGHTGTLDPDAEGVLPVCLGKATKVCDLLTDKDKEYRAVLLLGQKTDTQDISGKVIEKAAVNLSEQEIVSVINSFVGEQEQIPPMYSALKVNGRKLYELAREGKEIERKPRKINVFSIVINEIKLPEITITVHCSKGTYIRTLCNDIGEKLGCYGCMKSLLRTRVAGFSLNDALKIDEIENIVKCSGEKKDNMIISVDSLFMDIPELYADSLAEKLIRNGNRIPVSVITNNIEFFNDSKYRLYSCKKEFVGIYEYFENTLDLKPVKIFME